jgi:hypothetical protein
MHRKGASPVLRGGGTGNGVSLPGFLSRADSGKNSGGRLVNPLLLKSLLIGSSQPEASRNVELREFLVLFFGLSANFADNINICTRYN